MMRTKVEAAGLQLVVEVADDITRYVTVDEQKVRQIILNLVGNSVKFTTEGGVTLRVKTVGQPPNSTRQGLQLVIEVEDSGCGIPDAEQQRIFEPFVQLQEVGAPGTGLGLSIVRVPRLDGGGVEVSSRVGPDRCSGYAYPSKFHLPRTSNSSTSPTVLSDSPGTTVLAGAGGRGRT